jgi:hypothetical protein
LDGCPVRESVGPQLFFGFAHMANKTAIIRFSNTGSPTSRRLRRVFVAGLAVAASLFASPAFSETTTVYGTTASIFSAHPGAFLPANTDLVCFSMNDLNCWDGGKWIRLYPSGRRHYVVATTDRIACSVIVAPRNDCWTGSAWYRLPKGQVFGTLGGFFSRTPGAFITTPMQMRPGTYISSRSPLREFVIKR